MRWTALLVATLACVPGPAWSAEKSDGYMRPRGRLGQVGPARVIESELPAEITLQVGERRSFSDVSSAATFSPKVISVLVSGGVLTILAVGPGMAYVVVGTDKKPKNLGPQYKPKQVTVKVKN